MVSPVINMTSTEKQSGISGIPTQLMVLHSGECPLRGGYAQSLTQWANVPLGQGGPEASWHWFVDPIAIVSMIPPQYAAWHASEANPMSEGFEQAGYARFSRAEWTTAEGIKQIDNLGWIMAQRALANGIPLRWLTTDEVEAVTKRGNRSIKGFCLHRQIDPETRTDPGDNYPFDLLTAAISKYMGGATPEGDDDVALTQAQADALAMIPTIAKNSKAAVDALLFGGENTLYKASIQNLIDDIPRRVATYKVTRDGKKIDWVQEDADSKSLLLAQNATIAALTSAVSKLAGGAGVTVEQLTGIIDEAVEKSLGDLTVTISAGDATPAK